MTTQPEALRLADDLLRTWCLPLHAAELRRLHALNQELLEALKNLVSSLCGESQSKETEHWYSQALAAIAKATGEQS